MKSRPNNADGHWTAPPVLRISNGAKSDEYRLSQGRVEFRPAQGEHWRELVFPDLQQHFTLSTKVGTWLARLYSTASLAKILLNK
jgi:hypothetical protein